MRAWLFLAIGLLVGGACGAAGFLGYTWWNQKPTLPADDSPGERLARIPSFGRQETTVNRSQVAALGRLKPSGEIIDIGGLLGDRLGKLEVQEGDEVKKGAVLGYLDSHRERLAERDALATALAEAKKRLAAETAFAQTQIREARLGVESASRIDPLDTEAQQSKVQALESELAVAQRDLQRVQSVSVPGAISAQRLDQQTQAVNRLTQELAAARAIQTKAETGQSIQLQLAQAKLAAAEAGLKRVEAASTIESLTKQLDLAEVRLDRTILRAPQAGRVLAIHIRPSERVDQQKPILQLGDTSKMYAVAEVYETDIRLIREGQPATVVSPALAQKLRGTTERIGWSVHKNEVLHVDPAASSDARVVKVWIRLDSSEAVQRLTNLQVDVIIDVASREKPTATEE